jgi:hypothetical protein
LLFYTSLLLFLTSFLFGGLFSGATPGWGFRGGMILQSVVAAGDRDDLRMVQEAVQDSRGRGHCNGRNKTVARGRIVQRPYEPAELDAIADAAKARGLSREQALALLGADTRDVYLNEKAYWRNVPANVWEYFIGGYQVIKKWLSYREQGLLGRALSAEEAREVTGMARRLAAIILLQPVLDENYRHAAANAYAWPGASE